MSFEWPAALVALALVPIGALAYATAQAQRPRYAARFTNLDLLANVVRETPSWRRHVPPALLLLALAVLAVALARPHATFAVPREQATVVLVTDVSGSMDAEDVEPTRLAAAREAALAFADDLPEEFRLGLVTFSNTAQLVAPPTTDRAVVESALEAMRPVGGTAMGDGLDAGVRAVRAALAADEEGAEARGDRAGDEENGDDAPPAVIVLLSDGESTVGLNDPLEVAAEAARFGIPVNTVALGTDEGTVVIEEQGFEQTVPVPPDRQTLREIADTTGGRYFDAPSADELSSVYDDLGSRIGTEDEEREITAGFAGGGLVLLLAAGVLSLLWFGRLP